MYNKSLTWATGVVGVPRVNVAGFVVVDCAGIVAADGDKLTRITFAQTSVWVEALFKSTSGFGTFDVVGSAEAGGYGTGVGVHTPMAVLGHDTLPRDVAFAGGAFGAG